MPNITEAVTGEYGQIVRDIRVAELHLERAINALEVAGLPDLATETLEVRMQALKRRRNLERR